MGIHRSLITAVTALLLVLPAGVAMAQDESPGPGSAAALANSAFADIFPTEVAGLPWDELEVKVGAEHINDQDAEESAEIMAILAELDATIDDITTVTASRINEDFTEFTFMIAFRVAGADAARLLEATLPTTTENLEQPRFETGEVAGKDVTMIYDDASPDSAPIYLYAGDDTVWLVLSRTESAAIEALDVLP